MNIEISGRNFEVTDRIRNTIESKFAKAEKHFADVTEMRCVLDVEKHRNICEIFVVGRNYDAKSIQESSETMDDAINSTFEALKRQARKHRDRLTDHRRRDGNNAKRLRPESWDIHVMPRKRAENATEPRIIRTDTVPIKPMSVEQAAMTLDDSHNEFIVFRDLDTDRVTVIYKRADRNFGMIAPDF